VCCVPNNQHSPIGSGRKVGLMKLSRWSAIGSNFAMEIQSGDNPSTPSNIIAIYSLLKVEWIGQLENADLAALILRGGLRSNQVDDLVLRWKSRFNNNRGGR